MSQVSPNVVEVSSEQEPRSRKRSLRVVNPTSSGKSDGRKKTKESHAVNKRAKIKSHRIEGEREERETVIVSSSDVGSVADILSPPPVIEQTPEPVNNKVEPSIPEPVVTDSPQRTPLMTQGEVWTLYATVLKCKSPDDIFDVFGRTFEEKWMLAWWNHRVGFGDLYRFYRSRDIVEFFRKIAHEVWLRMKHGQLTETTGSAAWIWRIHDDVTHSHSADDIFDVFGRNVEIRSELTWWLNKTDHGDLVSLGKGRDFVEYLRAVAHELWSQMNRKR